MTNPSPHLESMTVLDDLNFASGGVESRHAIASRVKISGCKSGGETDSKTTNEVADESETFSDSKTMCNYRAGVAPGSLAELSPNES